MNSKLLLTVALRTLANHKTRSLLTTLGIIIGVTSIITVMSIGEGAKYRVRQEIEKLGTNFIIAISKPAKQRIMMGQKMFKQSTYDAIIRECPQIKYASPALIENTIATYEGETHRANAVGVNPIYFTIRDWKTTEGDIFTESDLKTGKKVVVIGKTVKKELFGDADPIGKTIRIKKVPFKVVGVLDEKGTNPGGQDEDDNVFMPTTTMQRKIAGVVNKFMAMMFSANSKEDISKASFTIGSVIRQQHRLKPTDDDDYTVFSQDDISQATDATFAILNLLLFAVASIALIVGGIGIMNIMLVSVTERTKEIGIRISLGAQQHHILNQFLIEAVIICLIGGIIGVLFGGGVSTAICLSFKWPVFISTTAIITSLFSSMLIGIFFGYYPAYKASMLNPVDALADR
jgi:putative ABC transport system permease protein